MTEYIHRLGKIGLLTGHMGLLTGHMGFSLTEYMYIDWGRWDS